jgi:sugar lactone lactonase YvrE
MHAGQVMTVDMNGNAEVVITVITHRIEVATQAYACMLGGPQRDTLFMLTAETINPDGARAKANGRIEMVQVDVPGAGLP